MHELSLCESILHVIEQQASTQKFTRVTRVWLEIGKLACVEVDAMRFCFDVVMKDSIAESSILEIIEVPGQAWCLICEKNVLVNQRYDECPDCGSYQLQVNQGEQMQIKELEVV
jgi:hydrogenase nickel incorporation protein HypA/HybF